MHERREFYRINTLLDFALGEAPQRWRKAVPMGVVISGTHLPVCSTADDGAEADLKILAMFRRINEKIDKVMSLVNRDGLSGKNAASEESNLSVGGFAAILRQELQCGDVKELILNVPFPYPLSLSIPAEVSRVETIRAGVFKTAFRFQHLDEDAEAAISRYILYCQRRNCDVTETGLFGHSSGCKDNLSANGKNFTGEFR